MVSDALLVALFLHPLCTVGADYVPLSLGMYEKIFIYWNEKFKFNIFNILPKPALFYISWIMNRTNDVAGVFLDFTSLILRR